MAVVDLFITTWDRAVYGDAMAYQWIELDGGKKTRTLTINVPIEGGGSISSQVQVQEDDEDGGATPVLFHESTYTTYDTGSVQFTRAASAATAAPATTTSAAPRSSRLQHPRGRPAVESQ